MQKLQLTIPEPCHENWEQMTPTDQGRFCNACAKEVIDFSSMTDTQVLNYFTTLTHEKVCGRAWPDQLNRTISKPEQPRKRLFWYWNYIVMFFMFFAKGNNAKAQGGVKTCTELSPAKTNNIGSEILNGGVAVDKSIAAAKMGTETRVRLGGISSVSKDYKVLYVVDGELLIDKSIDAISPDDIDNMSVLQPTEAMALFGPEGSNGAIIITTRKQKVKNLDTVVVASEFGTRKMLGMVGMTGVSVSKIIAGTPDPVVKAENNNEINIYPNPVQHGNTINVSLKLKQSGLYQIQIIDMTGRIVLQKHINAKTNEVTEKIFADSRLSSGLYYISIIDNKGQLVNKSSFIFQ